MQKCRNEYFYCYETHNQILEGLGLPTTTQQSKSKSTDDDIIPIPEITSLDYVNLTSHPDNFGVDPIPISWGHPDPLIRGPVICTVRHSSQRNAIGAHSGSYCIYTGLAVAAGKLNPVSILLLQCVI